MYTKKEIKRDRKMYLKEMIKNANDLLEITQGTQLCWEVSCDYEKFDKNIIDILENEDECKEMIKDFKKTYKDDLFYRPIVIDADDGSTVNFQNLHYYKKDSFFVKQLNKYLYS